MARPHYKGGSGVGFPLLTYDDTIECKDSSQAEGAHSNSEIGLHAIIQIDFTLATNKNQLKIGQTL